MSEQRRAAALATLTALVRALCKDDPGMAIPVLVGAIVNIAYADLPTASDALIGAAIAGLQSATHKPAVPS